MNDEFNPEALKLLIAEAQKQKVERDLTSSSKTKRSRRPTIVLTAPIVNTTYNAMAQTGLFAVFIVSSVLLHIDFGVFAASSVQIKQALGLGNLGFGALQSMVFLGVIIGKKSDAKLFRASRSSFGNLPHLRETYRRWHSRRKRCNSTGSCLHQPLPDSMPYSHRLWYRSGWLGSVYRCLDRDLLAQQVKEGY